MNERIILRREKQVSPKLPEGLTREALRSVARALGVKRGRNTQDTINNLRMAFKHRTHLTAAIFVV